MNRKPTWMVVLAITVILLLSLVVVLKAQVTAVKDDPLVRMPGTQPGQVSLEDPNRCLNCHADYNTAVEPGFNWMGSMMAQSARDFLFFSAMTVAAQDAKWATGALTGTEGSTDATDLCLRCHFPKGWLEGRSDPTNATLMTGADWDGVQCDFCHSMWDPQFEAVHSGEPGYVGYWDEATGTSSAAADATYAEDQALAQTITLFNGGTFFTNNEPPPNYTEGTGGQYFVSADGAKRASFVDAEARHQMLYSRYHKSKYFCGTCHDVSNPVLANFGADPSQPLPSEVESAHNYMHVERTFSEFMLSAYGQEGGAAGIGPFAGGVFETGNTDNKITMCQDCHMRDVVGTGADKHGVPVRPEDSTEHPNSGQPLHDMTGGNMWVPWVLASSVPDSPNYDSINEGLLNSPVALTLDLQAGQGLNPEALLAGVDRAKQQLELAASIDIQSFEAGTDSTTLDFRVQNQTGHKLISGFPEGRRMFVNIKLYESGQPVYEINPYDYTAGTLKGLSGTSLGTDEKFVDELVYEMHPSSTYTGEAETLHFVLADGREKDNRIPPLGFNPDYGTQAARLVQPVWEGKDASDNEAREVYTEAEFLGGYDDVSLEIPRVADAVEISLYYQTTSREYVAFLRDEINGIENLTLPPPDDPDAAGPYVVQTDAFFTQLKRWGDTIWQLWEHNKDVPGAAPVLMAEVSTGTGGGTVPTCTPPDAPPELLTAAPGNGTLTLSWTPLADSKVKGYRLYYDQSDKAQLVEQLPDPSIGSYTDSGLTNDQQYCYVITAYNEVLNEQGGVEAMCESGYSVPKCATPSNPGQTESTVAAQSIETGLYEGNGKNQSFTPTSAFVPGDSVVVRVSLNDPAAGLPVANAAVDMVIEDVDGLLMASLSANSDKDGVAELTWATSEPKGKNPGTASGAYRATVTNVAASGYTWDGNEIETSITVGVVPAIEVIVDPGK